MTNPPPKQEKKPDKAQEIRQRIGREVNEHITLPELFYHIKTDKFYMQNGPRFIPLSARMVKMVLMKLGFYADTITNDAGMTALDAVLHKAFSENWVNFAGPIAGRKMGLYVTPSGERVLITSDAKFIEPKKGPLKWWGKFLTELLGHTDGQVEYLFYWLKFALQSLERGDFRPGQLLVLAGESGCGKSFLQQLITELLGGRSARPYDHLIGEVRFNNELAGSEHLCMEDEASSLDLRTRRQFGEGIKKGTVTAIWKVEGKNQDPITIQFFKRLSLSVNNQAEKFTVIPPMDEDLRDKIALLNCEYAELSEDLSVNWEAATRELPALVYHLRSLRGPRATKGMEPWKVKAIERFGMVPFHNAPLLELLSGIAPEVRLLEFIDQVLFSKRKGENWEATQERIAEGFSGPALELEQELNNSPFQTQVQKLLSHASTCGTYLSRLQTKFPDRFRKTTSEGKTKWVITAPAQTGPVNK